MSPYVYSAGNPMNLVDPSGMEYDFAQFIAVDNGGHTKMLLDDLHDKTGLTYYMDQNDNLRYQVDASGAPVIQAGVGSQIARDYMIYSINSPIIVNVGIDFDNKGSQWDGNVLSLDVKQITNFINGLTADWIIQLKDGL